MRAISDLTKDEAIDLWKDNGTELATIFSNEKILKTLREKNMFEAIKVMNNECEDEVRKILLWLDPTPITQFNLFPREAEFVRDIGSEEQTSFFTSTPTEAAETASGDVTENTEEQTS